MEWILILFVMPSRGRLVGLLYSRTVPRRGRDSGMTEMKPVGGTEQLPELEGTTGWLDDQLQS